MFANLATAFWAQICRLARWLRAFALLEDGPTANPAPAGPAATAWTWEPWPERRQHDTLPASGSAARAASRPEAPPVLAAQQVVQPARMLHVEPHPHRRRATPARTARRPGTPPPAPMACLSPIARRAEDRHRSRA
jgi:hypothetical protein